MRTGAQITMWGNLARDPEFVQARSRQGVNMKCVIMQNWTDFQGQKQTATYHASTYLRDEGYAKLYPIFNGAKGKPVLVTGEFQPGKGQVQPGQRYADYAWLNINRAQITALWSQEQRTEIPPVVAVQPTPAAASAPGWGAAPAPAPSAPPPAPAPQADGNMAPAPMPPPPLSAGAQMQPPPPPRTA